MVLIPVKGFIKLNQNIELFKLPYSSLVCCSSSIIALCIFQVHIQQLKVNILARGAVHISYHQTLVGIASYKNNINVQPYENYFS